MSYAVFLRLVGTPDVPLRMSKFVRKSFPLKATLATFFSALVVMLTTAVKDTPPFIWVPGVLALLLIWIDGATGMAAAVWEERFKSKGVWFGGAIKLFVYATLGVPAWFGAYLCAKHLNVPLAWTLPLSWCAWVFVAELASIRENLKALQKPRNGRRIRLGPVNKMLDLWDNWLAALAKVSTKPDDNPEDPSTA